MIADADLRAVRAEARRRTASKPGMFDDALQEGLVGWWQASEKRPAEPAYAFGGARQRIIGFVTAHAAPFGAPSRQGRRQVDERLLAEDETLEGVSAPVLATDDAAIAYHRPEIRRAIEALTPRQRAIVEKVALGVPLTSSQRGEWSGRLRPRLAVELAHLKELVA